MCKILTTWWQLLLSSHTKSPHVWVKRTITQKEKAHREQQQTKRLSGSRSQKYTYHRMFTWITVKCVLTLTPTTEPWYMPNSSTNTAWDLQLETEWPRTNWNIFSNSPIPVFLRRNENIYSSICMYNLTLNCHYFVQYFRKVLDNLKGDDFLIVSTASHNGIQQGVSYCMQYTSCSLH